MKTRKSLITLAAASALAIGGTGVAAAQDDAENDTPANETGSSLPELSSQDGDDAEEGQDGEGGEDAGSAEGSTGSVAGDEVLGSFDEDGAFNIQEAAAALEFIADFASPLGDIAGAFESVVDASDTFQGVVQDVQGFLASQGAA